MHEQACRANLTYDQSPKPGALVQFQSGTPLSIRLRSRFYYFFHSPGLLSSVSKRSTAKNLKPKKEPEKWLESSFLFPMRDASVRL